MNQLLDLTKNNSITPDTRLTRSQWLGICRLDCEDCAAQIREVGMTRAELDQWPNVNEAIQADTPNIYWNHTVVNSAVGFFWPGPTQIDLQAKGVVPSPVGMTTEERGAMARALFPERRPIEDWLEEDNAKSEQPDAPVTQPTSTQDGERDGIRARPFRPPWWQRIGRGE